MRPIAADTRNESYRKILDRLPASRAAVLRALLHGPKSNRQIAAYLGWPINSVTGRVRELRQQGLVKPLQKVWDSATERHVWVWATNAQALPEPRPQPAQVKNTKERQMLMFQNYHLAKERSHD